MAFYTSNTGYVSILDPLPLDNLGWEIVVRGTDFSTIIALIGHYESITWSVEMSGDGGGSVTLDMDHPVFSIPVPGGGTVLDNEYLWQLYEDGVLRVEFLGTTITEVLLDESQRRGVTISGPGTAHVLQWARVMPPGYGQGRGYQPPFFTFNTAREPNKLTGVYDYWYSIAWYWEGAVIGGPDPIPVTSRFALWDAIFKECQARGVCSYVTPMFTWWEDTAGVTWTDACEDTLKPGDSLHDLLIKFSELSNTEWIMRPGFQLDVRQDFGVHREDKVILFPLTEQKSVSRTRARDEIANMVVSQDVAGFISVAIDKTSVNKWGARESYVEAGTAIGTPEAASTREAVAEATLRRYKEEIRSWTFSIQPKIPTRRLFVDFFVGDWVGVEISEDGGITHTVEAYRLQAASGTVDSSGQESIEVTMESKPQYALRKYLGAVDKIGKQTALAPASTAIPPWAQTQSAVEKAASIVYSQLHF